MSYSLPVNEQSHFPLANKLLTLEVVWPLPLIAVGVAGIRVPTMIGLALLLAAMPWFMRLLFLRQLTRRSFVGGSLALLVVGALVGLQASYDPALGWPALLTLLGSVCLFFAIVNTTLSPRYVGVGLVIIAVVAALYFVGQYAHFDYASETGRLARMGRLTGSVMPRWVFFTPQPNALAGFLEGAFLLGLAFTWQARGGGRIAWGIATAVMAYALLISASRGAWMGLGAALGLWVLLRAPNKALWLVGGVGLVLWGYVIAQRSPAGQAILASLIEAAAGRLTLYRNSLYLLSDYAFTGIGLGDTFAMVYSRYQLLIPVPFLTYPHNLFLAVGLGYGLLGLVALIWMLVGFYGFVIRVERTNTRPIPIFRAAWLGATASFVHGLTDSPQFSDSRWTMPMLFALLGLAVATGIPAASLGAGRRWRWGGAALLAAALVILLVAWRPVVGAAYANVGAVYETWADLSPNVGDAAKAEWQARAATYFQRALDVDSAQPAANWRLGRLALDRRDFGAAQTYLERAYLRMPHNQAVLKALGLAYLWNGQLDSAEKLLRQLDARGEIIEELETWRWWWGTQKRQDLSGYAGEMVQCLTSDPVP